ncbi:YfhO family protein [Mongoliitalea daihaiensis]|uniref:YfhO family protein n=1 Tax=Mongoliitalea daihaiensis TaxID=2782006 RepID=UPI001F2FD66B|nr:YfhO family protein [Mongoliitalea daihaiensis]UJP64409.1 hypothetical protein IPZ59_16610 [Mongoliitalea daihaiensis]
MNLNFRKEVLPHGISVVIFYLIVLIYFSPMVFDGKIIFQNDILQWEGGAKEILDYRKATGEEALWTNRLFGGMPAYLVSYEIPGDITNFLLKIVSVGLPHPINSLFIGMIGMYMLLLAFKVRSEIAAVGAIAFAFNTFHLISLDAGHNAKIWAICLIPLIFTGIHLAFERKKLLGMAVFAFAMMLQLKFNHLQITYYTMLMVLIYGVARIYETIQSKNYGEFAKSIGILVLGLGLAIGSNASRFAAVLEYSPYSTRGKSNLSTNAGTDSGLDKEYAFAWSQGKFETLTFLIPFIQGGGSQEALPKNSETERVLRSNGIDNAQINGFILGAPTYWGDQPGTGGPIYGGIIMVFLFVIGLLYADKKWVWVFTSITVLSILLAWGKNLEWFNYSVFDFLPGYNKFRAVSMGLCMALFAIPILGSLGLQSLFQKEVGPTFKKLFIAFGIVGGLAFFFAIFAGMFSFRGNVDGNLPDWLVDAIRSDRKSMMQVSAFKGLAFVSLSFALIMASLKNKLNISYAVVGIGLLLVIDLWSINRRYLGEEAMRDSPAAQFFAQSAADTKILEDKDYYRVFNIENPFNEARTSFYHNSVGGYHGAKMKRIQELIERAIQPEIANFIGKAQEGDFAWSELPVLNMLNTRYLMAGKSADAVFRNPLANGPAWFPEEVIAVNSNDEEIQRIQQIDTRLAATVNTQEFGTIPAGAGTVKLTKQSPGKLSYSVEVSREGLLVLSEVYYPKGWKATINGVATELIRTNYLLRGIVVPIGTSNIELSFEPDSFYQTKGLTIAMQYLTTLLLIGAVGFVFLQKQPKV